MKRLLMMRTVFMATCFAGTVAPYAGADTTPITAGLNAPVLGATGGSEVIWGPIIAQTSMEIKGNTNTNYPIKYAGTFIEGSGGAAGSFQGCVNPGDPTQGPGAVSPFAWHCNYPVP